MTQQISAISISPQPSTEFITDCPLRIQEGLYIIRNESDGRVLEAEEYKTSYPAHVYLAPSQEGRRQTQIWCITKNAGKEFDYIIRSFALGSVLDIACESSDQGAHVIVFAPKGQRNQTWQFYGSRQGLQRDLCTIRSIGPSTVLDSKCPREDPHCDCLHSTYIPASGLYAAQEWSLVRFSQERSHIEDPLAANLPDVVIPRRPFYLQNVSSGRYATYLEGRPMNGPNVITQLAPSPSSEWSFVYTMPDKDDGKHEHFAISTASSTPSTLDLWGGSYINVSKFWPFNPFHTWEPIPSDGFFLFQNYVSKQFLCQSSSNAVAVAPATAHDNPACHWRLLDPATGAPCSILYDPALSTMPAALAGTRAPPAHTGIASRPRTPLQQSLTLHTTPASAQMRHQLAAALAREHAAVAEMLAAGCAAVVVAPRVVAGFRDGAVHKVSVVPDDAESRMRPHHTFVPCAPE